MQEKVPQFDLGSQCLDQNLDIEWSKLMKVIISQCPFEEKFIGCGHLKLGFPWLPIDIVPWLPIDIEIRNY